MRRKSRGQPGRTSDAPRKPKRARVITVDGQRYFWRVPSDAWDDLSAPLDVTVLLWPEGDRAAGRVLRFVDNYPVTPGLLAARIRSEGRAKDAVDAKPRWNEGAEAGDGYFTSLEQRFGGPVLRHPRKARPRRGPR